MISIADINTYYETLLSGDYWSNTKGKAPIAQSAFITFSFSSSPNQAAINNGYADSFSPATEWEKDQVRAALQQWASEAGLKFVEIDHVPGDIEFGYYDIKQEPNTDAKIAFSSTPNTSLSTDAAGVVLDNNYRNSPEYQATVSFTLLHEIGHMLGLKHPFEGDNTLPDRLNDSAYSVMSYNGSRDAHLGPLDVKAIQEIYGSVADFGQHLSSWNWDADNHILTQVGSSISEYLRGTAVQDIIHTGGGDDTVILGAGDDTVYADGSTLVINGGTGFDVAKIDADFLDRSKDFGTSGYYSVYLDNDFNVLQVYQSVERIDFNNGTIAFDTDGNAGDAYRLYQAAFNRKPDAEGLGYWIDELDQNKISLPAMANSFLQSNEFSNAYGTVDQLSNADFITLLYNNVLHREPDASGQAYWLQDIANGQSYENILTNFSQSAENIDNTANDIITGIWFL